MFDIAFLKAIQSENQTERVYSGIRQPCAFKAGVNYFSD